MTFDEWFVDFCDSHSAYNKTNEHDRQIAHAAWQASAQATRANTLKQVGAVLRAQSNNPKLHGNAIGLLLNELAYNIEHLDELLERVQSDATGEGK